MALHHGGKLREAAARLQIPLSDWLDLSTGINPHAYPLTHFSEQVWQRLPEENDGLETAAAAYYGNTNLLMTPGSQWSIQYLPLIRQALHGTGSVLIHRSGYAEHHHAWHKAGFTLHYYDEQPSAEQLRECDVCLIINPHNPHGTLLSPDAITQCQSQLRQDNAWLIVDEAFMDVTPELSVVDQAGNSNLIVLRSLGKFFGLAGLRVGALIAAEPILNSAKEWLGPWAISGPSRAVATAALQDYAWQQAMRITLHADSLRMSALLLNHFNGLPTGPALFKTVYTNQAAAIVEHAARKGILLRLLDDQSGFRIGLPATQTQWQKLELWLHSLQLVKRESFA